MNDNNEATSPKTDAGEKLPYHKPELKAYGILRTVTLARSASQQFESGLGVGYAETLFVDPNIDAGWSRHDRESGSGRGRRDT